MSPQGRADTQSGWGGAGSGQGGTGQRWGRPGRWTSPTAPRQRTGKCQEHSPLSAQGEGEEGWG